MANYPYYVTTTDKFMRGWGKADKKKNKLVFGCQTMEEAEIVAENARNRSDQSHVYIRITRPNYDQSRFYVQFKTKADYPTWYKEGSF